MKYILLIWAVLLVPINGIAQQFDPVSWTSKVEKISENTYNLIFEAEIESGWHLYSQKEFPDDVLGPVPTTFTFNNKDAGFELIGKIAESEGVEKFDKVFDLDLKYFNNKATFTQKIKVVDATKPISAEVEFMVCNDEMCLPPDAVPFDISLKEGVSAIKNNTSELTKNDIEKTEALQLAIKGKDHYKAENIEEKSYFNIFLLGFLGGLIALLTPCVFPMIPLTVSFFTKGAKNRKKGIANAILYGLFIFGIYLLLSLPFHLLDSVDPEILNNISTNVTLNIIFFVIFIVFAISFFGYFEITLPSSWSNAMDDKATRVGGGIGIFFMALTLALVSFSCTGPILGSLLGSSLTSDGGAIQLSFGMGGFGLALALPFALFALFPNWINSLPKSGGWLNSVKVVLGFIELALAFKFLSNADLVEHWGLLKREVFIGIWIVIGIGMVLYLFGKIKFPHDGPITKLRGGRVTLGILTLAFVLYLIPGLTNTAYANLKLLSGFPPPLFYSVYEKESHGPLGLDAYTDFNEGLAAAVRENKPIIIDFTGWACVNCRKMEEQVWSHPKVYEFLKEKYILISLYVDDREELDPNDQFNYLKASGRIKKIKTIGDKWATFQTVNFSNNSQPYYVLMDPNLNLLNQPVGYTPDADEYIGWLAEGLKSFGKETK